MYYFLLKVLLIIYHSYYFINYFSNFIEYYSILYPQIVDFLYYRLEVDAHAHGYYLNFFLFYLVIIKDYYDYALDDGDV
jgi:hypothetical protein